MVCTLHLHVLLYKFKALCMNLVWAKLKLPKPIWISLHHLNHAYFLFCQSKCLHVLYDMKQKIWRNSPSWSFIQSVGEKSVLKDWSQFKTHFWPWCWARFYGSRRKSLILSYANSTLRFEVHLLKCMEIIYLIGLILFFISSLLKIKQVHHWIGICF